MTSDISSRVSVAHDMIGHPQQRTKPVTEGVHYTTIAYSDWADSFIPTIVRWSHGAVDDFSDREQSARNQALALQEAAQ